MTPFARMILRDYADKNLKMTTIPVENFTEDFINGIVNAKCFECSDVVALAAQLTVKKLSTSNPNDLTPLLIKGDENSFLPHERTWIEFGKEENSFSGILLECPEDFGTARVILVVKNEIEFAVAGLCFLDMHGEKPRLTKGISTFSFSENKKQSAYVIAIFSLLYSLLAIINSPSVIGRQEFPAHKGFEKSLRHSNVIPPGAHLRPWTKITLDVTTPSDEHENNGGARLTGAKALHYCRTHIRIKNGKLERVRGHWRGDAALGVVRSDYKVKA